jgi:hypothetical protein
MTPKELNDSLVMLQIITLGRLDVIERRTKPLKQAFAEVREHVKKIKPLNSAQKH